MNFIIDTENYLTPDLQYLLYLYNQKEHEKIIEFENKTDKNYKNILVEEGYLTSDLKINKLKSSKVNSIENFITDLIPDFRNKFKNKKTGAIGDINSINKKFIKFFKDYPNFLDKEIILSATDRYINSCRNDNYKYMMQADYFIFKNKNDGGGTTSTLATYCEEVNMLPASNNNVFF